MDGAMASNREINRKFNQTLDEILESREIRRENIPEYVTNHLRDATMDPLKLIDGSLNVLTSRFFVSGYDDEHTDIYRAFFQKQLDLNNPKQMKKLASLVDRLGLRFFTESDDPNTLRRDVLTALTRHSGLEPDEFDLWYKELYDALYLRRNNFKRIVEISFKEEGFNDEIFFHYWQDPAFRSFIVDSNYITKARLTGNIKLLIHWTDELEKQQRLRQFSTYLRSSYRNADEVYNVDRVVNKDEFWNTVLEAANEDTDFANRVSLLLDNIKENPSSSLPNRPDLTRTVDPDRNEITDVDSFGGLGRAGDVADYIENGGPPPDNIIRIERR